MLIDCFPMFYFTNLSVSFFRVCRRAFNTSSVGETNEPKAAAAFRRTPLEERRESVTGEKLCNLRNKNYCLLYLSLSVFKACNRAAKISGLAFPNLPNAEADPLRAALVK
jgi:hypothetical protein